jgi:SNF2 family DNA or RNA helicase
MSQTSGATPSLITAYQSKYYAHELLRSYSNDHVGKLAGLLFDAQVEPKPHQIDAALFALQTPYLPGVILADEVGLGKTIEAGIVITQYWAERKRQILIIAPSSLRQQWQQELREKFLIPSTLLEAKFKEEQLSQGISNNTDVLICSYEFALRHETSLMRQWDLVICDEAHRLRNFYTGRNKGSDAISHIVRGASKTLLLTATPLQNRLEELYGLISVFDPTYFYSLDAFRERYIKSRTSKTNDDLVDRVAVISKRTLRKDADKYIHFTKRLPLTIEFLPSKPEIELYNKVNEYLQREELYAFSNSQRHLTALIIRKRLGSSTYAVASTLENIANRLNEELQAGIRRDNRGVIIVNDLSPEDLTDEEWEELEESEKSSSETSFGPSAGEKLSNEVLEAMRSEVNELRSYAELARSITVNEKASKLNEALDLGFERLRELGAPEKAIIFTDSTKTQEYIARSLVEVGRAEGLILFNGSNDSTWRQ